MAACVLVICACVIATIEAGCGQTPVRLGVLVNEAGLIKAELGRSSVDVVSEGLHLLHRDVVTGAYSDRRVKEADVVGDEQHELLVELPRGTGLAVLDAKGVQLFEIPTTEYLTDFGPVTGSRSPKHDVALYLYPNQSRGATFRIVTAEGTDVASWDEERPPSGFDSGIWRGTPALFYLRGSELVVRSSLGELLTTLPAPSNIQFRSVHVNEAPGERVVLLASGSGYTPYHMVCVYDSTGRLVFQEIAAEHAFKLDANREEFAFTVWTRSMRWRYHLE